MGIIQAQASAKGVPTKALWKQHRSAERARKMARRVRLVLQSSNQQGALQAVTGPTPEGHRQEFTTKSSLEKACLEEAGRRFTQANNTPMLQTNMIQRFGEIGANRPEFKKVLARKSQPLPTDDIYTTKLLQHLNRPPNIIDLPPRSLQEYTMGWRKSRETTASSLLGIHFGHYMAGTFNPEIAIFNVTMADLPMRTSYSPQRWRKGLNVMLEKTPGNFNVEKLRIILLFEADFNANNKWIGRAVMFNAEINDLLADKQYGSCRNKAAVLQCLNKGLFYDLLRQMKKPAALCLNDAKSCYDRITLLAAALCLCRLGAPINAVKCMTTTIHRMNHHIHTIYGDSQQSANHNLWAAPIASIGQGNGTGPSIWAAVSSPMFEVMCQEGFYALLQGAISLQNRTIAGFAFVDDTDLCVTHPTDQANQVAGHMQKAVTLWEGLLHATGGALVPEKCFWYLVAFEHSNNRWKYLKCNQAPGNITILDMD